jgi:hypothetical protein
MACVWEAVSLKLKLGVRASFLVVRLSRVVAMRGDAAHRWSAPDGTSRHALTTGHCVLLLA